MPPHCDTMDGPVVRAAQEALHRGDVSIILPYVPREGEEEVIRAFDRVMRARQAGEASREVADLYFFETVVRIHRAGEGAPYMFSVMMTMWLARPIRLTAPMRFILGSLFGFMVGGMAGLIQANVGLNLVLHNTQWVVGIHAHTMLLAGLSMLLFAVVYALLPLLTGLEVRSPQLVDWHFWGWLGGTMLMTYAMGMAGARGMLRRTLYAAGSPFEPYMIVALIGGLLVAAAFVAFLVNILWMLGRRTTLSVLLPERWVRTPPVPAQG